MTGPLPAPQLPQCRRLGTRHVEGPVSGHQLGVADCRRALVSLPALTRETNNSGSMEPAFYRGDILFLMNPQDARYDIGDITVYKV